MTQKPPHGIKNGDSPPLAAGARLERAVEQLGITQAQIARRTSAPASYVNDVIRGRRSLSEGFAGTLQNEFGIDRIWLRHGEGQMFRRLPPQPSLEGGGHMTPLPLLDQPCKGNPLDCGAWAGSTHPVPRGQARPTAPDLHRYVLRVSGQGSRGGIRDGDLVVVETLSPQSSLELGGCWCIVVTDNVSRIRQFRKSERPRGEVWGWCLGIVWRPFPPPD